MKVGSLERYVCLSLAVLSLSLATLRSLFFFGGAVFASVRPQGAKTEMEKLKFEDMTCKEAMKQVCKM